MTFDPTTPKNRRAIFNHMLRTHFPAFGLRSLQLVVPDFENNWHVDALLEHGVQVADGAARFTIVNAPPRSLKSIIFSGVMPAFILGQNPAAQVICLSHSQDLADTLARITLTIMRSPFYAEAFPNTKLTRTAVHDLKTSRGGYRLATSIGGGVTGRGGDFIIVDDPIKAGDADSEATRPRINAWFDQTLPSRLNRQKTSVMMVVMQRMHEDDLTGHLLEKPHWRAVVLPAVAETDEVFDLGHGQLYHRRAGELLHPALVGEEELARLKVEQGSRIFDAQYQQDPAPAEGQIFKRAWLKHGPVTRQPGDRIVQSWDAASKGGAQNDYSVCITAIVRRREVLILDVFRDRLEFPQLKKKAVELALKYKPYKLLIEDAAAGTQLIQMLRAEQPRGMPLPIAIKAVNNKVERAVIAAARIEAGALTLPETAPWLEDLVQEMMAFPSGKNDDQVDALGHLMAHTQNWASPRAAPSSGQHGPPDLMHREIDPDISLDY